jgi:hypothetical protein
MGFIQIIIILHNYLNILIPILSNNNVQKLKYRVDFLCQKETGF